MTCAECGGGIDYTAPYFWGKDGGEWHPRCLRATENKGSFARGMWSNTGSPFSPPDEYLTKAPREPWVRIGPPLGAIFVHERGGLDSRAVAMHVRGGDQITLPRDPCVTQVWRDGECACGRFALFVF